MKDKDKVIADFLDFLDYLQTKFGEQNKKTNDEVDKNDKANLPI